MAEQSPSTTLTIRISAQDRERLERLAEATSRSKSWLAMDAIRRYLELEEWQISEIEAGLKEADAGDFASEEEVREVFARWTRAG